MELAVEADANICTSTIKKNPTNYHAATILLSAVG